jgi:O-antigen/teichoic acid export membrane protein
MAEPIRRWGSATSRISVLVPWILVGTVCAGLLNYLFGLAMVGLFRPAQYSVFASANALLLVMGTVANAAVPWLLAREIAKRREGQADQGAVWAALVLNLVEGAIAGAIAFVIALTFAGENVAAWVGAATLGFFVASTGMGWALGHERFALLAGLVVAEVVVRIACATLLVALGFGPAGAYIGAVLGAAVIFVAMLPAMWHELRPRRGGLDTDVWRTALGTASVQALVTALSVADVLFVSLRFKTGPMTASYQVAATLARTPLFVALAFATESFPALARRPGDPRLLSSGLERILGVLGPVTVIVMTVPQFAIVHLLPAGYHSIGTFLPIVALIGAGYSLVIVQSAPLRAAGHVGVCLGALAAGLTASLACMFVGSMSGISGMAVGAAAGAWVTVAALALVTERAWPGAARPELRPVALWIGAGVVLFLCRGVPELWLVGAAVAGTAVLRAALRGRVTA